MLPLTRKSPSAVASKRSWPARVKASPPMKLNAWLPVGAAPGVDRLQVDPVVLRPREVEDLVVAGAGGRGGLGLAQDEPVGAGAARHPVEPGAADQHVGPVAAEQLVVAGEAPQPVGAGAAADQVGAGGAPQDVVARRAVDRTERRGDWSSSNAPMSGLVPAGCGRATPRWSVAGAVAGSAAAQRRVVGGVAQGDGLGRPAIVGEAAREQQAGRRHSQGRPGHCPSTSLPKMLWPLLSPMVPARSGAVLPGALLSATMLLAIVAAP